jgi:sugar lactone lactonase YvrE
MSRNSLGAWGLRLCVSSPCLAAACGGDDGGDEAADSDATDDATTSPTTSNGPTTGGPTTTASTTSMTTDMTTSMTDPDVTGDPSGPSETGPDDTSTTEPLDPPTEPEIMYERPPGSFFENLDVLADGRIIFTDVTEQEVLTMTPTGEVEVMLSMDDYPISVAVDTDGTIVVSAHDTLMFDNNPIFQTTCSLYTADGNGGADLLTEMPGAMFINGIMFLEPGLLLAADSGASTIWRVDTASGDVEVWLNHQELSNNGNFNGPGANGLKLYDNAVWVSNSVRNSIARIPLNGTDPGTPMVYWAGRVLDDFTIAASGNIYATTHSNAVFIVPPDLNDVDIAGPAEGVVGNTSAVFGGTDYDDETIYVATDGGLFVNGGNPNASGPARIVRLPVGEPG